MYNLQLSTELVADATLILESICPIQRLQLNGMCMTMCVWVCDVCIHSGIHDGGTGNREYMIDR